MLRRAVYGSLPVSECWKAVYTARILPPLNEKDESFSKLLTMWQ